MKRPDPPRRLGGVSPGRSGETGSASSCAVAPGSAETGSRPLVTGSAAPFGAARSPASSPSGESLGDEGLEIDALDHAVGEHASGDAVELFARNLALDRVRPPGAHLADGQPHVADRHLRRSGDRVHHAGLEVDFDAALASGCAARGFTVPVAVAVGIAVVGRGARRHQLRLLHHRVGQQLARDARHLVGVGVGVDQKDPAGLDPPHVRPELGDLVAQRLPHGIHSGFPAAGGRRRAHVDAVNHAGILATTAAERRVIHEGPITRGRVKAARHRLLPRKIARTGSE